jgi:hypothetical protein
MKTIWIDATDAICVIGPTPPSAWRPLLTPLSGVASHWLYIAVTGHLPTQPPEAARKDRARFARAYIAANQHRTGPKWRDFDIAHRIITTAWPDMVMPDFEPANQDTLYNRGTVEDNHIWMQ